MLVCVAAERRVSFGPVCMDIVVYTGPLATFQQPESSPLRLSLRLKHVAAEQLAARIALREATIYIKKSHPLPAPTTTDKRSPGEHTLAATSDPAAAEVGSRAALPLHQWRPCCSLLLQSSATMFAVYEWSHLARVLPVLHGW